MIEIVKLDMKYCNILAETMSTDTDLHVFLYQSPKQSIPIISATEYYERCRAWEAKKNGVNFCILADDIPIGSISYTHEANQTAGVGMWIASKYWNMGYGTTILGQFKQIVKEAGYAFLIGSIQKTNPRSKRMCEKLGATFPDNIPKAPGGHDIDHETKWYPLFTL